MALHAIWIQYRLKYSRNEENNYLRRSGTVDADMVG